MDHFLIALKLLCITGVMRRLVKETECPVCLSEMRGRVWQCVSGHILCEICHDRPEVSQGAEGMPHWAVIKHLSRGYAMEDRFHAIQIFRGHVKDRG
jgi:hypothetical protein